VIKSAGEESASGGQIPLRGDHDVNDLTELVDRSVQIDPRPLTLTFNRQTHDRLGVPARSGRINQQWGEPVHLAINRDVIDLDAPFGQQLFDVTVREPIAQVPPHSPMPLSCAPSRAGGEAVR
jgi:hypothetical protein